jgi:hypothetical protein
LVKLNSQLMRARNESDISKAQKASSLIYVSSSHPYFYESEAQQEKRITQMYKAVNSLSPATQRVLDAVYAAMYRGYSSSNGWGFVTPVTRDEIAIALNRKRLVPYDITMLRRLAELRYLTESRRALPRREWNGIWLGSGYEFVYAIYPNNLWLLIQINDLEWEHIKEQQAPALDKLRRDKEQEQLKAQEQAELRAKQAAIDAKEARRKAKEAAYNAKGGEQYRAWQKMNRLQKFWLRLQGKGFPID